VDANHTLQAGFDTRITNNWWKCPKVDILSNGDPTQLGLE